MADLINRDDVLEDINRYCKHFNTELPSLITLINEIPTAEPKVAYACDGRRCGADCSDCGRTTDIEHAKNFTKVCDSYFEKLQTEPSDLISRADAMSKCKNAENELTDEAERKGLRVARFIIGELPSADRPTKPILVKTNMILNNEDFERLRLQLIAQNKDIVLLPAGVKECDRPSGEWLHRWNDVECLICGEFYREKYNYCPNCGARMEETK